MLQDQKSCNSSETLILLLAKQEKISSINKNIFFNFSSILHLPHALIRELHPV